jgi:hypothetical protein
MIQLSAMKILRGIPLLLLWLALPVTASDRTPPPVQPATSFPAVEVHPAEHVAIAAEPYDTQGKRVHLPRGLPGPRRDADSAHRHQPGRPAHFAVDARILFETADGDRIRAAEPDDVERMMTQKERQGSRIPLPAPLPPLHVKPKGSIKEIEDDFNTFEYSALAVEPHTTRAGFLFYDVSGLKNPLMGAKLYLHDLRDADGKQLFYFEIPFDKYLQSKSSQMN